jgi:putative zinc finger protein
MASQHTRLQVLASYALGELSSKRMDAVRSHIDECAPCRSRLSQYEALVLRLSSLRSPSHEPGLEERLVKRIRDHSSSQPDRELLSWDRSIMTGLPLWNLEEGDEDWIELVRNELQQEPDKELAWLVAKRRRKSMSRFSNDRLFLLLPSWHEWVEYLSAFPPGDDKSSFRKERLKLAETVYYSTHPSNELLRRAVVDGATSASVSRKVLSHMDGPMLCFRCRSLRQRWQSSHLAATAHESNSQASRARDFRIEGVFTSLAFDQRINLAYSSRAGLLRFAIEPVAGCSHSATLSISFRFKDGLTLRKSSGFATSVIAGKLAFRGLSDLQCILIHGHKSDEVACLQSLA